VLRGDGRRLPFADRSFDLVHSSAVLEHVGSRAAQRDFLRELLRVARRAVFVTTPNRWFPVEFHSVLPLVHWLPPPAFRAILRRLGHDELADERNLNLLGARDLAALTEGLDATPRLD
jgi:ubiquinone/menaquinone biosynthesis C-methylase UbiE